MHLKQQKYAKTFLNIFWFFYAFDKILKELFLIVLCNLKAIDLVEAFLITFEN